MTKISVLDLLVFVCALLLAGPVVGQPTGTVDGNVPVSVLPLVGGSDASVETTPNLPAPMHHVTTLAEVDRTLLDALRAGSGAARQTALQRAGYLLQALMATTQSADATGRSNEGGIAADWLAQTDRQLDAYQAETRRTLRKTLAQNIGVSPHGAIAARDLAALHHVSDALRVLRESRKLGGGDSEALTAMQSTYWTWLQVYGRNSHLGYTAIGVAPDAPIFGQRVVVDKNGAIQIYQLTGQQDHTVRWLRVATPAVPNSLLRGQALRVDLAAERAPWLLLISGDQLNAWIAANRRWLAAIQGQVRLVLRVRGDYTNTLMTLPAPLFAQATRRPYVLPAPSDDDATGRLYLIEVQSHRIMGSWPMRQPGQPGNRALKALISRIVAAGAKS